MSTDSVPVLAEAKLVAPRRRDGFVTRPRISEALDECARTAVTLVAAPAGFGKTTAVGAWLACREGASAWVTLDAGDNDPVQFWIYAATAVDRVRQGLGRGALQRLRTFGAAIEPAVDELMNGIATYRDEVVLVLDDLQEVTDTECMESLEYALTRVPANARVVLVTRVDPGLKFERLRAGGDLAELRAAQLAFTEAETRGLIAVHAGLELEAAEVEVLRRRTEGWPAALYLAALWLRGVEDRATAVDAFGVDQRYVADYLSSEVIGALDDDTRSFLIRVSVLGWFTAELCDGVLERTDSARVLAELERSNLLVVNLDRGRWFRVHSLFAEFAQLELGSAATLDLHRRAAAWLRARGLYVEAIEHAAEAGDHEVVADLLVERHLDE